MLNSQPVVRVRPKTGEMEVDMRYPRGQSPPGKLVFAYCSFRFGASTRLLGGMSR